MEKVCSLLHFNPDSDSAQSIRHLLEVAPQALGLAGASQIKVAVFDAAVADGSGLSIGTHPPDALVSWWTDCSWNLEPFLEALNPVDEVPEAYLVCESIPLRYQLPLDSDGRCQGFSTVACFEVQPGIGNEEFVQRWFGPHCAVAVETQRTHSYVRNEVVRALTPNAQPWAGIVEEMFPIEALTDPAVFFDAVDNPELQRNNEHRMFQSVAGFLDLSTIVRRPLSEYRFPVHT